MAEIILVVHYEKAHRVFRKKRHLSQKGLADTLQISGLDVDKNAIQRIEAGKRFVTDIELVFFSNILQVSFEELLGTQK